MRYRLLLLAVVTGIFNIVAGSNPARAWCKDASGRYAYNDAPGNASTACTLPLGGFNKDSVWGFDDVDWFRMNLNAGTTYRLHVMVGGTGDLRLGILNSSGSQIFYNDDASSFTKNPVLGFTAPYTGLYFARVTIAPGSTQVFPGYTIVRTLRNPDVSCPIGTVIGFNRGQELKGAIARGGQITYCFGAAAGSYFSFTIGPRPGSSDPLEHPGWFLQDVTTGKTLTFHTDAGTAPYTYGPLPSAGKYYLKITGNQLLDQTGEFILRRRE